MYLIRYNCYNHNHSCSSDSNLYIHSSYTLNNIYYTMDYKYSFMNIHDHNNYQLYKQSLQFDLQLYCKK
ncbi:protein of unknown function [Streptococcus thermophilus]|nr:protein of unknown function [Streptococcus thermophilus]CAD0126889.1 protein of unknown function [Streptococcus thermophilus]CAD0127268.1 protein of unknown function [Streptococcus thermophilus]CAD0134330.1 protein of unknown function [Streptococcus thermophilus]CAD0137258.1 protein of unknown function [Streptococcus thermophilus]